MKKIQRTIFFAVIAVALVVLCTSGARKDTKSGPDPLLGDTSDTSYAFGIILGAKVLNQSLGEITTNLDYKAFLKGFEGMVGGGSLKYTVDEAQERVFSVITALRKAESGKFLSENAKRQGVVTTASGLQYEVLREGDGESPLIDDEVAILINLSHVDGKVLFESDAEFPEEMPLSQIFPGLQEGIPLMKTGGKSKFYMSSELGAGDGYVLIAEVDLVEIL
jgi:FKBP-type peptidyl-prolyl cis-trans isomerase